MNKLSLEDMNGVFLALTQMISEENFVRKFAAAERLPGAMNIMADALGVTYRALQDAFEDGEFANSDNLLKFADELNRSSGRSCRRRCSPPRRSWASSSTTSFQAQRVANGGFIDAFNSLLETLNRRLQSREGRDFFRHWCCCREGRQVGLEYLVENAEFFADVIQLIIGLKLASWLNRARAEHSGDGRQLGGGSGHSRPSVPAAGRHRGADHCVRRRTPHGSASAVSLATQLFTVQGRAQLLSTTR